KALTRGKRLVRKIIMTKAMAGNTGINQDKLTMAFVSPTFYCSLPLQPIQVINIRSQTLTVDVEDESQTNRHFRRGHHNDHDGKDLPCYLIGLEKAVKGNQIDVHRVQHQLDAHEDRNGILFR